MPNHKYDIFATLGKLNTKQFNYYQDATVEEQKSIQPLVLQRWLTGTKNEQQIMIINSFVNPYVFSLYNHPNLLWKLMCCSTTGNPGRNNYPKQAKKSTKLSVKVVKEYFKYSPSEATDALNILEAEDVLECAYQLGYESTEITKLKKELK